MQRRPRGEVYDFFSGFNPHPLRGAGATQQRAKARDTGDVSILTRSEERVQRCGPCMPTPPNAFQSSPAPRSGCNLMERRFFEAPTCFNPHPLRGAGATFWTRLLARNHNVSILTRSEERVQLSQISGGASTELVSILTRSEERVQRDADQHPGVRWHVSILTRSEERVQHHPDGHRPEGWSFQSSPAPRSGCNSGCNPGDRDGVRTLELPLRGAGATAGATS